MKAVGLHTVIILTCAGHMKEESSFWGGRKPPEPQAPQRTRMNPALKFGPPVGDTPSLQLSIAVPELRVCALATGLTDGGCTSSPDELCMQSSSASPEVARCAAAAWARVAAEEVWWCLSGSTFTAASMRIIACWCWRVHTSVKGPVISQARLPAC